MKVIGYALGFTQLVSKIGHIWPLKMAYIHCEEGSQSSRNSDSERSRKSNKKMIARTLPTPSPAIRRAFRSAEAVIRGFQLGVGQSDQLVLLMIGLLPVKGIARPARGTEEKQKGTKGDASKRLEAITNAVVATGPANQTKPN
ncbi:hypothetical protein niasHT_036953 [Heterodera trifolii]|uniref:Uncharacterized protein n=1 Tax=Heterodera trifolii TaxID=157864 RepID=A0ABD2IKH7_9BILA